MGDYQVGFQDLKLLADGFEEYHLLTRKESVGWLREHKTKITPEFMDGVRFNSWGFFYHLSTQMNFPEDEIDFNEFSKGLKERCTIEI